jgi:hypothetical protein
MATTIPTKTPWQDVNERPPRTPFRAIAGRKRATAERLEQRAAEFIREAEELEQRADEIDAEIDARYSS